MKKWISFLGVLFLCMQSLILSVPAFAQTALDFTESPLKISVDGRDNVNLTEKTQQIEVTIDDQTVTTEDTRLEDPHYVFLLPEGVTYQSSPSKVSIEDQADQVSFQFLDKKATEAVVYLEVDIEKLESKTILQVIRKGEEPALYSNELTLLPQIKETDNSKKETAADSELPEAKMETSESQTPVEAEVPEKRQNTSFVNLENGMVVSPDLPDDLTVAQYLAQYSYPHLPVNGITAAYQSVETDLHSLAENEIALVRSAAEFKTALGNTSIKGISIAKSFALSGTVTGAGSKTRPIIIEGNGMLIDFKTYRANISGDANVTIQNLNMYHASYYGAVRATGSGSIQKFHNVNDYGSQVLSSQGMPVQISGDFISRFDKTSYISPIDGTSVTTQYNRQQNFESSNIEFLADSVTTLETYNGANIDLTAAGEVVIYENAKLNLIAGRQAGGTYEGSSAYGISARDQSSFIMKKNSEIDYTYTDPGDGTRNDMGVVWFDAAGSTFTMENGAKMKVNKDSHSGTNGIIHFRRSGTFNLINGSTIEMDITDAAAGATALSLNRYTTNYPAFNMSDHSQMILNMTSTGTGTNPILNIGEFAKMSIDTGSSLDIQAVGYQNSIITLGNGSASRRTGFIVGTDSTLNVNSLGRTNSDNDVVSVGSYAEFTVQRLGNFQLSADRARYIFTIGTNSSFQFTDAKLVDFGFTKEPAATSALINMNGNFLVDIQRVKAWKRSGTALNDAQPDYDWNPMFGMVIPYTNTAVASTSIQGNSTTAGTAQNFKDNYNTGTTNGFQRLAFEFIPDVKVTIDNEPVDNPTSEDSRIISGSTNAKALIRISDQVVAGGYSSFPKSNNTIPDPTESLDGSTGENYTVQADEKGHFEFEVPQKENIPFVAGNTIEAYAYLNGKSDTASKVVTDTTAPTGTPVEQYVTVGSSMPDISRFIPDLKDSNPAGDPTAAFTVGEDVLAGYLAAAGTYDLTIIAVDVAGNETTFSSKLYVLDKAEDLTGLDVALTNQDIDGLSDSAFKDLLKEKIAAEAYRLKDGAKIDLSDKIIYDFSTVKQAAGVYLVTMTVSEADSGVIGGLNKTVTITIGSNGPTKPVDPDNPQEGNLPPEGTENPGTGASGYLRMDYAPSNISFGKVPFAYGNASFNAQSALNEQGNKLSKQWIQVSDDRSDTNGWSVKVSQPEVFKSNTGETLVGTTLTIPKGKIRNSEFSGDIDTDSADAKMSAKEIAIGSNGEATLFGAKDKGSDSIGKKISIYQWDPTKVTITVPGGKAKVNEAYETTINWSLVSEPAQ